MQPEGALERLLRHPALWRADTAGRPGHPTGFEALDNRLPGGGWPVGCLTEILVEQEGIGEWRLILPALAGCSGGGGWITLIDPPYLPYAPVLAVHGIELSRLLLVRGRDHAEHLWAAEQALRSGACGILVLWLPAGGGVHGRDLRRLQLATEQGGGACLVLRDARAVRHASPAALRLRIRPRAAGLGVEILKCRGRRPAGIVLDFSGDEGGGWMGAPR